MSTLNEEDLVSVDEINNAIGDFVGKHSENISTWIDGETVTIQISNIGVRDKLFSRLAYLVKNTSIKNGLMLFNMSAKCTYVSNQIIRFTCTLVDLANDSIERSWGYGKTLDDDGRGGTPTTPPIDKFFSRLERSNVMKSDAYAEAWFEADRRTRK